MVSVAELNLGTGGDPVLLIWLPVLLMVNQMSNIRLFKYKVIR